MWVLLIRGPQFETHCSRSPSLSPAVKLRPKATGCILPCPSVSPQLGEG